MKELVEYKIKDIIHTIRGKQVLLDKDLAKLYEVETRTLNQAVKINKERFPEDFMFQLTEKEVDQMVSQFVIPSKMYLGGFLPYAFTEQGVSMLSGVLRSKKAIEVNIKIMRAFVSMRKFIMKNVNIFQKLGQHDKKFIEYDEKFEKIFKAMDTKKPKQGIFYDGQIFDAYKFVSDLIRSANKRIILIDNFIDDSIITLFTKAKKSIKIKIYTKSITKKLMLDIKKYNLQYNQIELKKFSKSHDRFLIIDEQIYHFGASLKDLGKKWFAFSKLNINVIDTIKKELK